MSITIKYGKGKVTGQLSTDQVSFGKTKAEAIPFLYTTQVTGFDHMMLDGMLGLAPGIGMTINEGFVAELYKQGTIRKNMFSLYFGDKSFI